MDNFREVLRTSMRWSLDALTDEDKLAMAWIVVCGPQLGRQCNFREFKDGVVHIDVTSVSWKEHLEGISRELIPELGRVAGLPIAGIHFQVKR